MKRQIRLEQNLWVKRGPNYGKMTGVLCPGCKQGEILYNGNYYCENWRHPHNEVECDWALPHPVTKAADRNVCDQLGIGYD